MFQSFDGIAILSKHEERNLEIVELVGLKAHFFRLHQLLHFKAHFGIALNRQQALHFRLDHLICSLGGWCLILFSFLTELKSCF